MFRNTIWNGKAQKCFISNPGLRNICKCLHGAATPSQWTMSHLSRIVRNGARPALSEAPSCGQSCLWSAKRVVYSPSQVSFVPDSADAMIRPSSQQSSSSKCHNYKSWNIVLPIRVRNTWHALFELTNCKTSSSMNILQIVNILLYAVLPISNYASQWFWTPIQIAPFCNKRYHFSPVHCWQFWYSIQCGKFKLVFELVQFFSARNMARRHQDLMKRIFFLARFFLGFG